MLTFLLLLFALPQTQPKETPRPRPLRVLNGPAIDSATLGKLTADDRTVSQDRAALVQIKDHASKPFKDLQAKLQTDEGRQRKDSLEAFNKAKLDPTQWQINLQTGHFVRVVR